MKISARILAGGCALLLSLHALCYASAAAPPSAAGVDDSQGAAGVPPATTPPDLSGRQHVGRASVYSQDFAGKKMADGTPLDLAGSAAASRTLPLGTRAKVTNLDTGQSAVVTVKDRGPYAKHRIVDLSPGTAAKIGISPEQGVGKVAVAPIAVPLPDGSIKPGVAAHETQSPDAGK